MLAKLLQNTDGNVSNILVTSHELFVQIIYSEMKIGFSVFIRQIYLFLFVYQLLIIIYITY